MRTLWMKSAPPAIRGPKPPKWESNPVPPESLDAPEKCVLHEPFSTDFEGSGYREKYPP